MAFISGYVDNGNGQPAHYNLLETLRQFAVDNGWEVLRYVTDVENRELILKGSGYTGLEEIFVGARTYQSADADYYNLLFGVFAGYAAANPFDNQPGAILTGVPAHNQRVDFWLCCNPQRITGVLKLGTPVYESFYVGKFLPYAQPSQYPMPLVCGGALTGAAATRFSDTSHSVPYRSGFRRIWNNAWITPSLNNWIADLSVRDTGGHYPLLPIEMYDTAGLFGMLEGVFFVSGFDNLVENTLTIDGVQHLVVQDVWRTGFGNYFALALA